MCIKAKATNKDALSHDSRFLNREFSLLEFNKRIMLAAGDQQYPLLERLRFLAIAAANLDEFIAVRFAKLINKIDKRLKYTNLTKLAAWQQYQRLLPRITLLYRLQQQLFVSFKKDLNDAGIYICDAQELPPEDHIFLETYFREQIVPDLNVFSLEDVGSLIQAEKFSYAMLVAVRNDINDPKDPLYYILPLPADLPRFIEINKTNKQLFVTMESVVTLFIKEIFHLEYVDNISFIALLRDSKLIYSKEEPDYLKRMRQALDARPFGKIVSVEMIDGLSDASSDKFLNLLGLKEKSLAVKLKYSNKEMIGLSNLLEIVNAGSKDLRFKPLVYQRSDKAEADYFALISKGDILLHHPYQSFDTVLGFLQQAALDKNVFAIQQTIYRTDNDSKIIKALIKAAKAGKQVSVVVELRARFNEADNLKWVVALREAGAEVIFGELKLKIHAKMLLISRYENEKVKYYAHISTGNYHCGTARLYTDLSLLTSDVAIASDISAVFAYIAANQTTLPLQRADEAPLELHRTDGERLALGNVGDSPVDLESLDEASLELQRAYAQALALQGAGGSSLDCEKINSSSINLNSISISPLNLRTTLLANIQAEIEAAKASKSAAIWMKMNSLVDKQLINKLYEASQAGVDIKLIVRGMCTLRPGVPNLSENIMVKSIVGRFLEHSRVYCFANGGLMPSAQAKIYISSADLMPRNLDKRVELLVPIKDKAAHTYILKELLLANLLDTEQSYELLANGEYVHVSPHANLREFSAQDYFVKLHRFSKLF